MAGVVHGAAGLRGVTLGDTLLASLRRLRGGPLFRWRFTGFRPSQILVIPPDLHLADPALAHEFYHGRFPLAGRVVRVGPHSPFMVEPPSGGWETALHDFGWLRHLAAVGTELADAHARALVSDWIAVCGKRINGAPWRGDVTARRVIAWLSHADMMLHRAPAAFEKRFLKMLGMQVRYLRTVIAGMAKNEGRLQAAIALALAALALPVPAGISRRARSVLEREIRRQILPDGGLQSRNPAMMLAILADLIALQQCYGESNQTPSPLLMAAIDRMLPALRFFRHGDGALANFNGVGPMLSERLEMVLAQDDTDAVPFTHAPYSGYQRLVSGQTTVIADIGAPPPRACSCQANAGCLSFEMSSGAHRFIINCGIDPFGQQDFRFLGRLTAAHSTMTLNNTSSCHFRHGGRLDGAVLDGPRTVRFEEVEEKNSRGFIASHDGYRRNFGLLHQRSMLLDSSGDILQGRDCFLAADGVSAPANPRDEAAIRFHLHPDVRVRYREHQTAPVLELTQDGGDTWLFSADSDIFLEDSICFSSLEGPVRTRQIVLALRPAGQPRVNWIFHRAGS
ncbi:MAG: Heparinase II/III family protein [Candidatus Tokpelaia hoelldobleri]|uniref:Heparinase II/III family protein n=1 Tax=Candidatus Tokpelaia hoelldobleri TaxID=1902579 RepID=A0A1U9JWU5_9HYPH|nr:MAG: Heparinase II/III family protein [Candidatus Tokpelaia hoelldoblerii]